MKPLRIELRPGHVVCICARCELTWQIAALERLSESMAGPERAESAGVVVTRRIVEMREELGKL